MGDVGSALVIGGIIVDTGSGVNEVVVRSKMQIESLFEGLDRKSERIVVTKVMCGGWQSFAKL